MDASEAFDRGYRADRLAWDIETTLPLRASIRSLLDRAPYSSGWTTQGFGMLRTYLDPDKMWRLNIWHSSLRKEGVSTIHDHPWDFKSWIINGSLTNMRYIEVPEGAIGAAKYAWQVIRTGEGGGPEGDRGECRLVVRKTEVWETNRNYVQVAEDIHQTMYADGTVTLNYRAGRPDGEHASVFWPLRQQWVDAEPAPAHPNVVAQ